MGESFQTEGFLLLYPLPLPQTPKGAFLAASCVFFKSPLGDLGADFSDLNSALFPV